MYYIYLITNKINNKVYIGKTDDVKSRWQKHLSSARLKTEKGYFLLHKAINKYKQNNFIISIIEEHEDELIAFIQEAYWIEHYKSNVCKYGNQYGYNLTSGGEGASGHKHTQESKYKMSIASSGKPKSNAHRSSLSLAHTGKSLTSEHKNNIGKSVKGKIRSDQSKENYSQSKLGNKNPQSKLNENQVKEIKNAFIKTKLSDTEIGIKYGVHRRTISDIRRGKTWNKV